MKALFRAVPHWTPPAPWGGLPGEACPRWGGHDPAPPLDGEGVTRYRGPMSQGVSLFFPVVDGLPPGSLHVRHEPGDGSPVLLVHGSVENGRVFWSPSGKGLAPFLSRHGFDTFAVDLRGHGASTPPIGRGHAYGQTETITSEIPAFSRFVAERHPGPQHWISHSWGGVLLLATLARYPELRPQVRSLVLFGAKRRVRVWNPSRVLLIDLYWNRVGRALALAFGYLPGHRLGLGADAETVRAHDQCRQWVREDPWVDPADGFDYGAALASRSGPPMPPTWFIAAQRDPCLGHPQDVRLLMEESVPGAPVTVLSRARGSLHDYGHISMLTHPDAERDHFPRVVDWLRRYDP